MFFACVLLNHIVLLKYMYDGRYNQLKHKATDEDMVAVDEMLAMMQAESGRGEDSDHSLAPTQFYPSRPLKREVSLDENGYPCLLSEARSSADVAEPSVSEARSVKSPVMASQQTSKAMLTWSKKPKLAVTSEDKHAFQSCGHGPEFLEQLTADALHPQDEEEADMYAAVVESFPRRRKTAEPAANPTATPEGEGTQAMPSEASLPRRQAMAKDTASATTDNSVYVSTKGSNRKLGTVRYHPATAQSYITHELQEGKKILVVSVSEKMCTNHKALAHQIFTAILAKNLDKPAAVALRDRLIVNQ